MQRCNRHFAHADCDSSSVGAPDTITATNDLVYTVWWILKVFSLIENLAGYEVVVVTCFFSPEGVKTVVTHRQICEVYGEKIMNDGMVRKCFRELLKMAATMFMVRNGLGDLLSLLPN